MNLKTGVPDFMRNSQDVSFHYSKGITLAAQTLNPRRVHDTVPTNAPALIEV